MGAVGMLTGSLAVLSIVGCASALDCVTAASGFFFGISGKGVELGRRGIWFGDTCLGDELLTLLLLFSFCSGDGARYRYPLG
jgi:hypothetical protein